MIFKTKHLPRYKEIGRLFWRHGRSEVFRHLAVASELNEAIPDQRDAASPEELARDLERMGPTFVKLGQILSSRADLLPKSYAAASLGRPDIRKQIAEDLEVLEEIASFTEAHTGFGKRHHLREILEQFRKALIEELDYQREAANLSAVGESMRSFPHIRVVQPIADYTTRAVLTMTYLDGQKLTDLSPIVRLDLDGEQLADELFRAYLKQILVDGLFHADPHPGNVFLTSDRCIGLLDLGMVGHVTPGMQKNLIKLLLAASEGRAEDAAQVAIQISETADDFDDVAFKRRIGELVVQLQESTLRQLDIGRAMLEFSRVSGEAGLFAPSELTLLGKTLLQLHEIGRCLDPSFNPNAATRRHVSAILNQRLRKDLTPGNLVASFLEMKDFVGQLPARVNKVFDAVGKGQVELKLRAGDTLRLMDGFQKVANRITAGLVLAALIVGAALLMQVQTPFELFGYPGLAILFFIAAAAGGIWLLFDIFFRDTKGPPNI